MKDKLARLIAAYLGGLGERIAKIESAATRIDDDFPSGDADWRSLPAFAELLADVHKLAGSAGSMGFDALGRAAAALDVMLQAMADRRRVPDRGDWNQIAVLRARVAALAADLSVDDSSLHVASRGAAEAVPEDLNVDGERTIVLIGLSPADVARLVTEVGPFGFGVASAPAVDALSAVLEASSPVAIVVNRESAPLADVCTIAAKTSLPVIACDGVGDLAGRVDAFRAGARAFLVMPFDGAELVDAVDRCRPDRQVEPLRVLAVDDDEAMLSLYDHVLTGAGMEVRTLVDPTGTLEAVSAFKPDLLVIDGQMPEYSGVEVAAAVRQQSTYAGLPVVFLSRETGVAARLEAMISGGDDYLTKPIDMDDLTALVRARGQRAREIKALIVRDGLTGLHNHASFMADLEHSLAVALRLKRPMTVAVIDVDFFKRVNDTWGHQAGDAVLQSLSRLLRQRLRRSDLAGRLGGEEFGVLLPGTAPHDAVPVIEGLLALFRNIVHHTSKGAFSVTFSAGVASCPDYGDIPALMRAADAALYAAKEGGRNQVVAAPGNA